MACRIPAKRVWYCQLMNIIIIVVLFAAGIYLGSCWISARNEVNQLRVHVAALKRQLARAQTTLN